MERYQVLERTLEVLDERGWCRVVRENGDGNVCIVGAVEIAQYGCVDSPQSATYALTRALGLDALANEKGSYGHICEYNDDHTEAEVRSLVKEALRKAKAEAGIYIDLPSPQPDEKTGARKVAV